MMIITIIAAIIAIIGALNWLLIGAFSFNLVTAIFGTATVMTSVVYIVVGIAGLWLLYYLIAMAVRSDGRSRRSDYHRDYDRTKDFDNRSKI